MKIVKMYLFGLVLLCLYGCGSRLGINDSELFSSKNVVVTNYGAINVIEDINNEDNERNKTILAGESMAIFSVDVQSINESMDVETVVFTVDTDLTSAITNASLYLDDTLIATNSNSDITATTIIFDDLDTLIIEEMTSELKLVLNTETIGYQKVGATTTGITITNVALKDIEGVSSGKDAANVSLAVTSKDTDIVPVILTASVVSTFSQNNRASIRITALAGDNTSSYSNETPTVAKNNIVFSTKDSEFKGDYKFYLEGDTNNFVSLTSNDVNKLIINSEDLKKFSNSNLLLDSRYYVLEAVNNDESEVLVTFKSDAIIYSALHVNNSDDILSNFRGDIRL